MVGKDTHPPATSLKLNGPPGTGKTTQLLERLSRLLEGGLTPRDVAFVTYRKQMAAEFLHRLAARGHISQEAAMKPWKHDTRYFGTLHAVCNRLTGDRAVVEKKHRRQFMASAFSAPYDGYGDAPDTDPAGDDAIGTLLFDAYDWCIENKQPSFTAAPGWSEIAARAIRPPTFSEFAEEWQAFKSGGNPDGELLTDFAGMLREVDENDITPPGSVLLIDEYHDMTPIMASICEGWMDSFDTVIVGGDPLQAIYSYKGADPRFFTELSLPELLLDPTYRVPAAVWEYACGVIRHEPPDITPHTTSGQVKAVSGPPTSVVNHYGTDSLLILARTQSQLHSLAERLRQAGVIFRSQPGIGGWNTSTTLLDLYNALQKLRGVSQHTGVNPVTGQQTLTTSASEPSDDGTVLLKDVTLTGSELRALTRYTPASHLSSTKKSLKTLAQSTTTVDGPEIQPHVEPTFWTVITSGPESVDELLTYDAKDTLKAALKHNSDPCPLIDSAPVPDLLTIHASKGKGADTVALYDGIPGAVQTSIRTSPENRRAESRVWYVACTRAAETLLVHRDHWDYLDAYLPSTG